MMIPWEPLHFSFSAPELLVFMAVDDTTVGASLWKSTLIPDDLSVKVCRFVDVFPVSQWYVERRKGCKQCIEAESGIVY